MCCGRRNRRAFSVLDEQIVFPISALFCSSVKHICCHISARGDFLNVLVYKCAEDFCT